MIILILSLFSVPNPSSLPRRWFLAAPTKVLVEVKVKLLREPPIALSLLSELTLLVRLRSFIVLCRWFRAEVAEIRVFPTAV